jgi:hypothetical protein
VNRKILTIGILWLFVFSGCAALFKKEMPEEPIIPELKWDLDSYAEFVKQNMTEINARYSSDYVSYEFVVDCSGIGSESGETKNLPDSGLLRKPALQDLSGSLRKTKAA